MNTTPANKTINNIILFSIFLLWNFCQPLVADDLGRASADVLHNHTLSTSLVNDFNLWTGRLTAQLMVYLLFSNSYASYLTPLINVLNSTFLVMIFNLLYRLVFAHNYQSLKFWLLTTLYIGYFVAIGTFSQDFLWKTVAIQYAWGLLLLLVVIWQFYLNIITPIQTKWLEIVFYIFAGVFIGFYNEVYIAFIISLYLTTVIIWHIFKRPWHNLLQARYIIFFIATLIASIVSITAPGNFVRRQTYLIDHNIDVHAYSFITKIFMTYIQFFRYGYHVLIAIVLMWIGVWTYKRRKILPRSFVILITFLMVLLNLNILSFVEVAYYSPIAGRMLIFIDSIIFLILFRFFYLKLQPKVQSAGAQNIKKWKYLFYGFSVLLFVYISFAYLSLYQFDVQRSSLIVKNKNAGNKDIIVPAYCKNKILKYPVYFDDIKPDKNNPTNKSFAECHGLNSISTTTCN